MENLSLNLLIFSPILVSLFFFIPIFRDNEVIIRRFTKTFMGIHFAYAICFWIFFNPEISYFDELFLFGQSGIPSLGIRSAFSMDGLSMVMVVLSSFLFFISSIASKTIIRKRHKLYYGLLLALETSVIGVFTAADMYIFFLFWELELIPMYFLISLWGSGNSQKSAMKFLLYTFMGSLFMLVGILLLNYYSDTLNQQMTSLFSNINVIDVLPINIQILISSLLMIGFFVKMPVIPLHTWLPDAHCDAPAPVSILLAGLLLKMGAYGFIKFNMILLPDAFKLIAPALIVIAVINVVHGGLCAYNQNDIKKIVAYSSISNMGIVLLGLCTINEQGTIGGIFHMVSHGLICAGLFAIVGIIYSRTKTRDINAIAGLAVVMPNLAILSVMFSFAAVGVPLLMSFVSEFLTFWGAFNIQYDTFLYLPIIIFLAMSVLILSTSYMFKFIHKIFFGTINNSWSILKDISAHEFIILSSLLAVIIFFGIQPMSLIETIKPVVDIIIESAGI